MRRGRNLNSCGSPGPCAIGTRRGLTLLELMLVLAVLVAIASFAWPTVYRAFSSRRLRLAAEQIQEQWLRARSRAMTTSEVQAFSYQPGTGQYRIETFDPTAAPADATAIPLPDDSGDGLPLDSGSSQGVLGSDALFVSPDGVVPEEGAESAGPWTEPILFYADGAATDARVVVCLGGRCYAIDLRGLTGRSQVSDWSPDGGSTP